MEEEKGIANNMEYKRVIPRIGYYMKSKNIAGIFKRKCALFAAGGNEGIINLLSNSQEHMGNFCGHKEWIRCLCRISNTILASGSNDMTIKIWDIEHKSIITTLYGHKKAVSALCDVGTRELVSGSGDKSLIIWSKSTPKSSIYSPRQVLTGHTSEITGIIALSNTDIISGGQFDADLRIWNIDQGLCIRHLPYLSGFDFLYEMKQHIRGDLVVNYWNKVKVIGAVNNWASTPIKQFNNVCCGGYAIEFLSENLLLRGGDNGQLEFIDYAQTHSELPPTIKNLHSDGIDIIQRVAKNIVITASSDGYLKVIDPIYRKLYLCFKNNKGFNALAYFYQFPICM